MRSNRDGRSASSDRKLNAKLRGGEIQKKTIEVVSDRTRLMPRGSFITFLEQVSGSCAPWTDQDLFFTHRVWAIINSAEYRALLNTLNRQQAIMIDELNHRMRNILALVRSVSKQARRRYGSLNSYSQSLEARIHALAAVHDITSGLSKNAIELKALIRAEFAPYEEKDHVQVSMQGENPMMRADIAPIFSLVIHELTTNAAKYGALSVAGGTVDVTIERGHHCSYLTTCLISPYQRECETEIVCRGRSRLVSRNKQV